MERTLLIVDDIKANREILKNILGSEYIILEAANGKEAITVMNQKFSDISAVILDLSMPVMNGFEVLKYMQGSKLLSQIPAIISTGSAESNSEEEALSLGAKDYLSKPYKATIIKKRIANTINLRETAAMVNAFKYDELTGLYSRKAFFEKVGEMVSLHEPGFYVMGSFDIDKFKVINDQYGTEKGDEVLKYIAGVFKIEFEKHGGIVSRIAADDFAILYPATLCDSKELGEIRNCASAVDGLVAPVTFCIGRYTVDDLSVSPSGMYDRALLAAASVKGRVDTQIAVYDTSMRDRLIRQQEIVNDMKTALTTNQFEVWYQPQYEHSSSALIGAEALVRWNHPENGMISPGVFVPIFEQNGFIYELDKYVWEHVCRFLSEETEAGRTPIPVSVNISRYDVFRPDIVNQITGLVKKYDIPVDLLRLEITESAFSESIEQIVGVVKQLTDLGFTLEIDDFGSGYSSLNTLKSVPAQVVKLDMKFLENENQCDAGRGGNIVESVVRMTKWLGMSVIAEGVETIEQANYLKSIGCNYLQGFLYARPMPENAYRQLCMEGKKGTKLFTLETVENLDNNHFWDPNSMDTLIFNSYVGAACIFEVNKEKVDMLRANDQYIKMLGGEKTDLYEILKMKWADHLSEKSKSNLFSAIRKSIDMKTEVTDVYLFSNLPGCPQDTYLRSALRVIASVGDRLLVYCTSENITAQRISELRERHVVAQLQMVMDNVNCGITAVTVDGEHIRYLMANERYYSILGYTREQYEKEIGDLAYTVIYPDDKEMVKCTVNALVVGGKATTIEYRALRRDGKVIWLRSNISTTQFEGIDNIIQLSTFVDITEQVKTENVKKDLLDNLSCGAALYELKDKKISVIHLNKRYWELVGRNEQDYEGDSFLNAIYPEDRIVVDNEIKSAIREKRDISCDIRILSGKKDYIPFHIVGRVLPELDGKYTIYTTYSQISNKEMSIQEMFPIALSAVMGNLTEIAFVKDKNLRYICCSQRGAELAGLTSGATIIGKTDYELLDKSLADIFTAEDRQILENSEAMVDHIDRIPSSNGLDRFIHTMKFPLKDSKGNTIGIYGIGHDVTEEQEIKSQFELLTNNIPGGIASYEYQDGYYKITFFNDGFCKLFDLTHDEYVSISKNDVFVGIFKEDLPTVKKELQALIENEKRIDCTFRVHLKNDGYKWINLKASVTECNEKKTLFNAVLFDVTEREEAAERLRISEEQNRLAILHSKNVVCRYDIATKVLNVSSKANKQYELDETISDVPDTPVNSGKISPDTADTYLSFYRSIRKGKKSGEAVFKRKSTAGWRWLEANFSTIFSDDGKPVSAVVSYVDITDQIEKESAYKRWQDTFRDREPDSYSLFCCDLNKITSNRTQVGNLISANYESGEFDFNKRTGEYVSQHVVDDDKAELTAFLNQNSLLSSFYQGKRILSLDYREKLPEDNIRWLRLTVSMVEYPHTAEVEAYMLFENIDKEKREEILSREASENDSLTGVLNRATFKERMNSILKDSRPGTVNVLMMLDVDGFKQVNDVFGHAVGDQALVDIAGSIRSVLRKGDMVGRLGGDEFMIFLTDVANDDIAENKAQQICALIRRSFSVEVEISGSIGIAMIPRDGIDFEELYKKADAALYYVKGSGKDNCTFYNDEMASQHLEAPKDTLCKKAHRRILIVDDSRIDHAMMTKIFENDFIVEKAKDGNTALIRLRHYGSAISAVLLDLMMPGMDGFAVLKRMQESTELRSIPVVVVSGDESRETSLRAIRAGAVDFVTKPIDSDVLRIRVQSAISKAENDRLRAQNNVLEFQNSEVLRYKTVLERSGTVVIEHDWINNSFIYDRNISSYIAGKYDDRGLWHIMLSDFVADTQSVKQMQELVHSIAADRKKMSGVMLVHLKTPSNSIHWFRMNIYKTINEFGLTGKIYITFVDVGESKGKQSETENMP